VAAGASGAIYGLIGLYAASLVVNFEKLSWPFLKLAALLAVLGVSIGLQMTSDAGSSGAAVSHVSHVGGVLAGACVAALFLPDIRGNEWRLTRRRVLRRLLEGTQLLQAAVCPAGFLRPPVARRRMQLLPARPSHAATTPSPDPKQELKPEDIQSMPSRTIEARLAGAAAIAAAADADKAPISRLRATHVRAIARLLLRSMDDGSSELETVRGTSPPPPLCAAACAAPLPIPPPPNTTRQGKSYFGEIFRLPRPLPSSVSHRRRCGLPSPPHAPQSMADRLETGFWVRHRAFYYLLLATMASISIALFVACPLLLYTRRFVEPLKC
jgi:hypothetical protein